MRYIVLALLIIGCEELPTDEVSDSEELPIEAYDSGELPPVEGMTNDIVIAVDGKELGYAISLENNLVTVLRPWPNDFYAFVDIDTGKFSFPKEVYFSEADCTGNVFVKDLNGHPLKTHIYANGKDYFYAGEVLGGQDTKSYFLDGFCTNTSIVTLTGYSGALINSSAAKKDLSKYAPLTIDFE